MKELKQFLLSVHCERGGMQYIADATTVDQAIQETKKKEFFFDSERKRSLGKIKNVEYIRQI